MDPEYGKPCGEYPESDDRTHDENTAARGTPEAAPAEHEFVPPWEKRAKGHLHKSKKAVYAAICAAAIALSAAGLPQHESHSITPPVPEPTSIATQTTDPYTDSTASPTQPSTAEITTAATEAPTEPAETPEAKIIFFNMSSMMFGVIKFDYPEKIESVEVSVWETGRDQRCLEKKLEPGDYLSGRYAFPDGDMMKVVEAIDKIWEAEGYEAAIAMEMRVEISYVHDGMTFQKSAKETLKPQLIWWLSEDFDEKAKNVFSVRLDSDEKKTLEVYVSQPDKVVAPGIFSIRAAIDGTLVDPQQISIEKREVEVARWDPVKEKTYPSMEEVLFIRVTLPDGMKKNKSHKLIVYVTTWLEGYGLPIELISPFTF